MSQMQEKNSYYFQVDVREGARGCADDDTYVSRSYDTFAQAYKEMIFFDLYRHWRHLRHVQSMYIWRDDYPKVYVYGDGFKIATMDLVTLAVTEEEFDNIINSVNAEL